MNEFQLLSDIFRLLGAIDRETVRDAERLAPNPAVAQILRAFSDALSSTPATVDGSRSDRKRRAEVVSNEPVQHHDVVVQGGLKQQAQERPLTTLLAAQGPVKASELVRFLKGVGVAVPFKQKESRSRLLGRADAQLAKMDSPRRQAVLRTTRKELGIDETRGWVEVIRGDQPGK